VQVSGVDPERRGGDRKIKKYRGVFYIPVRLICNFDLISACFNDAYALYKTVVCVGLNTLVCALHEM